MLRPFSLELTSLVTSDPTWKVPKGSRSASRRAKKTIREGLKDCTELINRTSVSCNMPVSGSEKRGLPMLDCRFNEKEVHVPIKKRRFLLMSSPSPSPSAPVASSQCTEETAGHTKGHDVSNKHADLECSTSDISSTKNVDNVDCITSLEDKKSEEANKGFSEGEDFSGISILAAAACSSSLGADSTDAKDGLGFEEAPAPAPAQAHELPPISETHLSTSRLSNEDLPNSENLSGVGSEPIEQLITIPTTVDISQNVASGKGAEDTSSKVDTSTISHDISRTPDEEKVGSKKQSARDDRFHWDLNVVMDAWEDPFESPMEENDVASRDAGKNNHDDSLENKVHDLESKLTTRHAAQDSVLPGELEILVNQIAEENNMKIAINNCNYVPQPTKLDEESLISNCDKNVEMVSNDSQLLCHNRISKPTYGLVDTALDPATDLSSSGTINEDVDVRCLNLSTTGFNSLLENVKSSCASDVTQRSLCVSSSSDIGVGVKSDTTIQGFMKTSQDRSAIAEDGGIKSAEFLEQPNVTSSGNVTSHSSGCVEGPSSASTKCAAPAPLCAKEQDFGGNTGGKFACSDTSSLSKETCGKSSSCLGEADAAEALINQDNDAKIGLRKGYDCQYEDGEVREATNEHLWDSSDIVDREVEYVDYESDDMGPCTINPTGYLVSGSSEVVKIDNYGPQETAVVSSSVSNVDNEVGGQGEPAELVEDYVSREGESKVKLHPQCENKPKESVSKELLTGRSSSSDMDIAVSDDEGEKGRLATHASGGLVDDKCNETRAESKPFRRKNLQSRIEGPVGNDMSSREERLNRMESRYEESSSIRSFDRPRYYFQNQGRGRQGDNWDSFPDNRRGIRRRYPPIMHRLSRLDEDANMDTDNGGYMDVQSDAPPYSHQLLSKSRSGDHNEEDDTGLHSRRHPTGRTFSPGRPSPYGRGRSIRFNNSYLENRGGGRGRYNNSGPSPDDRFQSSLKYRRPLSFRERSLSPFGNGRGHPSRGKSPSQPRSRSPIMWNHSPRGRSGAGSGGNSFVRQHRSSRSPNFGSEVRMQRLRSTHHQQPEFGPDDAGGGFRSIPRNRSSPPPHHFREFSYNQRPGGFERSPGRIRMRGDRAGIYDPPRNLKYHRISEERDHIRYDEESFDGRRKHYGPTLRPPVRHNNSYEDSSSMDGRLHHQDMDDSFSMPKGVRDRDGSDFPGRGLRGSMDNRIGDLPRRFRGDHSYPREQDGGGKFNSGPKQFGVGGEDQYRSSSQHGGRFGNMDSGVNRGRRYDYFDNNRRKQYDPPSFMKRNSESDGSEKRLNHNLDENFQGGSSEFCGRPMRSFDGRLSTRLREEMDSAGCGQERKLDENPQ